MKYSIITINYNNRDGLERTIKSVINQTYQDFEYIIIDGGSTDGSVDVIKKYADKIDYWVSEPDKGIYNAMNKGILQAHGEYLNFMNSGDCFYNDEVLENLLEILHYDIILGKAYTNQMIISPKAPITLNNLCIYGFNHQASFFIKELFIDSLYDENYKLLSDWKFIVEKLIFEQRTNIIVDKFIVNYDLTGISSQNMEIAQKEQYVILSSLLPQGIYEDYLYFSKMRSPLMKYIPFISKTYRLHTFIIKLVRLVVKFYSFITNKKFDYESNM